jgi:hypothetical protein
MDFFKRLFSVKPANAVPAPAVANTGDTAPQLTATTTTTTASTASQSTNSIVGGKRRRQTRRKHKRSRKNMRK